MEIKNFLQNVMSKNDLDIGFTHYIKGSGRYVVGITNNVDVSWDMLTAQYKRLYNLDDTFTFGGWRNGQIYYLDFGVCTDNLGLALFLGKQHRQKTIRDNEKNETIDIIY